MWVFLHTLKFVDVLNVCFEDEFGKLLNTHLILPFNISIVNPQLSDILKNIYYSDIVVARLFVSQIFN